MWTIEQLDALFAVRLTAAGGTLPRGPFAPEQISTDSRTLRPGELFVALSGENFVGADFLPAAHARGAAAAVVPVAARAAAVAAGLSYWPVASPLQALAALAADVRRVRGGTVVAVTGSNGKTTTKELLAAALGANGEVHRTHGNLNNAIGVPKTLFAWPPSAYAAVVEMGMNAPGEIAHLTQMAKPTVGVVTCVAAAHLQGLGSLAGVARAKSELYANLPAGAVRVVNADDAPLMEAAAPYLANGPTLRFGWGEGADVRVLSCRSTPGDARTPPGAELACHIDGRRVEGILPVVGRHNGSNAAAALAAALAVGVAPEAALSAMATAKVPGGRLAVHHLAQGDLHLVDDGYNANPSSVRAALQTVRELAGTHRLVAVLGDMRELGPAAAELHAEVGRAVAACGAVLWAVGELAPAMAAGARAAGGEASAFADIAPCLAALQPALRQGDWLLVKGSRGMRMERIVQALQSTAAQSAAAQAPPAFVPGGA